MIEPHDMLGFGSGLPVGGCHVGPHREGLVQLFGVVAKLPHLGLVVIEAFGDRIKVAELGRANRRKPKTGRNIQTSRAYACDVERRMGPLDGLGKDLGGLLVIPELSLVGELLSAQGPLQDDLLLAA